MGDVIKSSIGFCIYVNIILYHICCWCWIYVNIVFHYFFAFMFKEPGDGIIQAIMCIRDLWTAAGCSQLRKVLAFALTWYVMKKNKSHKWWVAHYLCLMTLYWGIPAANGLYGCTHLTILDLTMSHAVNLQGFNVLCSNNKLFNIHEYDYAAGQ